MKTLSVLRHAKAEHTEDFPTDFERPLTQRGHKDAAKIGALLTELEPAIDWIVSSPALRTRQTVEPIVATLAFKRPIVWNEAVYEAEAETLLRALAVVPPEAEHVLLVGHNPGMEALVSGLCAGDPARLHLAMATTALAHIRLEIFTWNQLRWGSGTLQALIKPKLLRAK